jgi:hypothetical protein
MGRSNDNERLVLECKFGKLVCEVVRDDDEYKEFAIDLHRNDGKVVQVCVVGTNEGDPFLADWMTLKQKIEAERNSHMVHIDLWDGDDQDCCGRFHTKPFGDGWCEEEEE